MALEEMKFRVKRIQTDKLPADLLSELEMIRDETDDFTDQEIMVMAKENFDRVYRDVLAGVGKTFGFFSFLTIFIAAIGLFSLVSFSTNRRTREIGVRKALGASVARIFLMLVKQSLVLLELP